MGAATGSLMGGTGCVVSGAVGALVAELSTDIMGPSKPLEQMKQKEQELGRKLTRAEFHALYPSVHKAYFEDVENTKKISKIIAAISASFAGHNIVVGAATGAVAVDYNYTFAASLGVSVLADTAFAAYFVEGLTLVGGAYLITEALDFIGVQAIDGGYQYHDRFYGSISDALAAVMLDNPITQAAGSIYLVAKTLLDVVIDAPNHLTDLDLTRSASYDNSHQQKKTGDHQPQRQQPQQSSSASTGGSMPPPEDPDDDGENYSDKTKELLGRTDQKYKKELFERAGKSKDESTLRAAQKEASGEQIDLAKQRGRTYDHGQKVKNAQNGLQDHIKDINNTTGCGLSEHNKLMGDKGIE